VIFGLRLADRNFARTGRALSLEVENSLRGLGAELLYVDPWYLESDFSLRLRAYAQGREERGYSKRESGIRADLLRKVTKHVELGTFLQGENVEITESVIGVEYLGLTAYQIATIGLTQSFDFRDHPLNPTKGWIINTALDLDAIAGEVAFGRATVRLSHYIPIGEKMLLALGVRGGLVYPWTSVPIDERYFSGGGTTVRSFAERELGPKDTSGNPIGGEAFTILNAELEFPLKGALRGAVFADAGNLSLRLQDAGVEDMRYGLGVGLRYKLPIGPIRLDVAVNPDPKGFEEWGAVHFSFGFAF
jgi:outer membrane protein assembly factor BamA